MGIALGVRNHLKVTTIPAETPKAEIKAKIIGPNAADDKSESAIDFINTAGIKSLKLSVSMPPH